MNHRPYPLLLAALTAAIAAQEPTPIAYGVPKDVHLFVHGRTSPTPDPGILKLGRACTHLIESGIHRDVIDLVTLDMPAQKRQRIVATIDHVSGLLGRVDWQLLGAREVALTYRLAMPLPEYLLLFRVPEERMGGQMDAMKSMLGGFAEMIGPGATVRDVERQSGTLAVLSIDGVPMQIAVGAVGDVMTVTTSPQLAASSMRMLAAGDGKGSIAQTERYQLSLDKLPEGSEDTTFVDMRGILDFAARGIQMASAAIPDRPSNREAKAMIGLMGACIDELNVFDHIMSTTSSDGTSVESNVLMAMQDDAIDSRLAGLSAKQEPWRDWHRMVPADAISFCFDSGIDPATAYDLITTIVRENVENGDQLVARGAALRNILSHVSGEVAWITTPQAGPEGCALGDTVCFIRMEKTDGVSDWLRAHLDWCARFLASRGQEMTVESYGGMYAIRLAAFPWMRPVIGVRGDHVIVASTPAAIDKIERVKSGQDPDIRSNERFAELGVGAGDAVHYLEYAQVDESIEGLANLMSAVGFFLSVLPEDRDSRPVIKLGAILTKLAPALRELDMQYDRASEMSESGDDAFKLRTIYRYR